MLGFLWQPATLTLRSAEKGVAPSVVIASLWMEGALNLAAESASWLAGYLAFFTPAGLGVRDVALATLLSPAIPASIAMAASVLFRAVLLLAEGAAALIGVVLGSRKPS